MIILNGAGEVTGGGASSGLEIDWIKGAEHEAATAETWDTSTGSSIASGVAGADGRVYQVTAGGVPIHLFLNGAVATPTTISVRMRVRPSVLASGNILRLNTTSNTGQCGIRFNASNGAFEVFSSSDTFIDTSATSLWAIDNWFDVEFQALIADSGSYVLKIWDDSGTLLETVSGSADMKGSATNDVERMNCGNTATDPYFDHVNIDLNGNLLGRTRVITRYPTGDGDLSQWPRGGTDTGANYTQVNEAVKNTTSYVQSDAADQYDFYTIDLSSLGGTMLALQVNALARDAATADPELKVALRIGGVTYEGAVTHQVTASGADRNCYEVWSNNPATGNAWEGTETVQIGIKSVTALARVQQVCAEILVQL